MAASAGTFYRQNEAHKLFIFTLLYLNQSVDIKIYIIIKY